MVLCWFFFSLRFYFYVLSIPSVGPGPTTLRSRVSCFTEWASQAPLWFFFKCTCVHFDLQTSSWKKKKKISSHFRLFSGTSFLKEELLGQRIWVSLTPFSCSQNIPWQPVDCLLKKAQEGTDSVAPCSLLPRKVSVGGQCAAASLTSFSSVGRVTECTSSPCRSSQGLGKSVSRFQFSPLYREGALRGT